jgi:carboxypeptidase PM20D1
MAALWSILGGFIVLVSIIIIRTLTFGEKTEEVDPGELIKVDEGWASKALSGAVKFATLSDYDFKKTDLRPFDDLYAYLFKQFPLVHKNLSIITSLYPARVYQWTGRRKDLKPIILMGHVDVVPVDLDCLKRWKHEPFKGDIAEGTIWGRGTLDDKGPVVSILAAAELLLKQGFIPERTIYFTFGCDEESSGRAGAAHIVEWLKKKKVEPEAVLDEGAAVIDGVFPGIQGLLGLVDVAEKGYLTVKLTVEAAGGHSATPEGPSAIAVLAKALNKLNDHPMPAHLGIIKNLFWQIGKSSPWAFRLVFSNLWILGWLAKQLLEQGGMTNAAIRTTIASTMIQGGIRDNVLPTKAEAIVNARLLPGDSVKKVMNHIRHAIADVRVKVEPVMEFEPSPVSPADHPAYAVLQKAIRQGYGDIPVAPFLVIGATDARYYAAVSKNIYRFAPYLMDKDLLATVHGNNERISTKVLVKMIQVYALIIQGWAGMDLSK